MVVVIVNCSTRYNERRMLCVGLVLNVIANIIFVDLTAEHSVNLAKYLLGLGLVLLTNMIIESASMTYIMKNLSHFVSSTTSILNAGFILEFVEVISKFLTIFLVVAGLEIANLESLHNFLVCSFLASSSPLPKAVLLNSLSTAAFPLLYLSDAASLCACI